MVLVAPWPVAVAVVGSRGGRENLELVLELVAQGRGPRPYRCGSHRRPRRWRFLDGLGTASTGVGVQYLRGARKCLMLAAQGRAGSDSPGPHGLLAAPGGADGPGRIGRACAWLNPRRYPIDMGLGWRPCPCLVLVPQGLAAINGTQTRFWTFPIAIPKNTQAIIIVIGMSIGVKAIGARKAISKQITRMVEPRTL